MTPVTPDLWCPLCDKYVTLASAVGVGIEAAALCPVCRSPLQAERPIISNPLPFNFSVGLAGALARLLIRTGILDFLEKRAAATKNKVDDVAIRIARSIIQEAAKL